MTSFEQRIRDAKTILEARWPDKFQLSEAEKDIVAGIMVDYAVQCELIILRERKDEKA
jgi:NADH:ubiquinone oxidoreductase subunit H